MCSIYFQYREIHENERNIYIKQTSIFWYLNKRVIYMSMIIVINYQKKNWWSRFIFFFHIPGFLSLQIPGAPYTCDIFHPKIYVLYMRVRYTRLNAMCIKIKNSDNKWKLSAQHWVKILWRNIYLTDRGILFWKICS